MKLSGDRVDRQLPIANEFTINQNADLYASILGIKRQRRFSDYDSVELHDFVSTSPVFGQGVDDLTAWRRRAMEGLYVGFPKDYLVSYFES